MDCDRYASCGLCFATKRELHCWSCKRPLHEHSPTEQQKYAKWSETILHEVYFGPIKRLHEERLARRAKEN